MLLSRLLLKSSSSSSRCITALLPVTNHQSTRTLTTKSTNGTTSTSTNNNNNNTDTKETIQKTAEQENLERYGLPFRPRRRTPEALLAKPKYRKPPRKNTTNDSTTNDDNDPLGLVSKDPHTQMDAAIQSLQQIQDDLNVGPPSKKMNRLSLDTISSPSASKHTKATNLQALKNKETNNHSVPLSSSRKSFLISLLVGGIGVLPQQAVAGIDVSGLKVDGGGGGGVVGNSALIEQLKSYDGSGSTRVRDIKTMSSPPPPITTTTSSPVPSATTNVEDRAPVATWAYRANPGITPTLSRAGSLKTLYRYNDMIVAPSGKAIGVQFEFPSDWLQLDRMTGGIQYIDQRNGDKLYVFRAPLPTNASLDTVAKATVGDLLFDGQGSFVKSGQTVEGYKVTGAETLSDCPVNMCASRRRFKIKYSTVTGNGLTVERRALVDAYQVENDIYMLTTTSNAIKFDQKDSPERQTVEKIVNSFQIDA